MCSSNMLNGWCRYGYGNHKIRHFLKQAMGKKRGKGGHEQIIHILQLG